MSFKFAIPNFFINPMWLWNYSLKGMHNNFPCLQLFRKSMQSLAKSIGDAALSSNVKVVSTYLCNFLYCGIKTKNLSFHAFWQKKTLQSIQMCYAATLITATTASNNGLIRFFWQWQPLLQLSPHSSFYKNEKEKMQFRQWIEQRQIKR